MLPISKLIDMLNVAFDTNPLYAPKEDASEEDTDMVKKVRRIAGRKKYMELVDNQFDKLDE